MAWISLRSIDSPIGPEIRTYRSIAGGPILLDYLGRDASTGADRYAIGFGPLPNELGIHVAG